MTFLNKLSSARVLERYLLVAGWHLAIAWNDMAIAITSECIFLTALKITTISSEKKKLNKLLATKLIPRVRIDDKLKGKKTIANRRCLQGLYRGSVKDKCLFEIFFEIIEISNCT